MRKLTCSLEVSILIILFCVVIVLALFGIVSQADAAPSYPSAVYRAVYELQQVTGSNWRDLLVLSYQQVDFSSVQPDCTKRTGLRNFKIKGYLVKLFSQGMHFIYRVDDYQVFLCHVGVESVHIE